MRQETHRPPLPLHGKIHQVARLIRGQQRIDTLRHKLLVQRHTVCRLRNVAHRQPLVDSGLKEITDFLRRIQNGAVLHPLANQPPRVVRAVAFQQTVEANQPARGQRVNVVLVFVQLRRNALLHVRQRIHADVRNRHALQRIPNQRTKLKGRVNRHAEGQHVFELRQHLFQPRHLHRFQRRNRIKHERVVDQIMHLAPIVQESHAALRAGRHTVRHACAVCRPQRSTGCLILRRSTQQMRHVLQRVRKQILVQLAA